MISSFCIPTIRITRGPDWATICYAETSHGSYRGGELMIHSSRGTWAHRWSNIAQPFDRFLVGADTDYLAGKLCSARREFDFHASMAGWKKHLTMARRTRQITEAQLREIWDATCADQECGLELFLARIDECRPIELRDHEMFADLSCYAVLRRNGQVEAFWRELWPLFVERLSSRTDAANEPASLVA